MYKRRIYLMRSKNERFYRVGDWDGKKHEMNEERIEIWFVEVTFISQKKFNTHCQNMERVMEQILDTTDVICEVDKLTKTLKFFKQSNQCLFKKTQRQIKCITKGWRKRIQKLLVATFFQIRFSLTGKTIIIHLI